MDTNSGKDQNYQLITTDGEENDETEDRIEPAKQSPSAEEHMAIDLFLFIAVVPIVATKAPFSKFSSIY